MVIEAPKTINDYEKILKTILELQGNPYCDYLMFMDLEDKKEKIEVKINELKL